jgi:hypothetical protein
MDKKIFSIIVTSILIFTLFGAISASANECVLISGTVKGKFMNVWCDDELETTIIKGATVTIEKIHDGKVVATTTTKTDSNGYYKQEVLKGTNRDPNTYRVTVESASLEFYGETYVFPEQSKTVQVKGKPITVDFSPTGSIGIDNIVFIKNIIINDIINNLIDKIINRFPHLFNL